MKNLFFLLLLAATSLQAQSKEITFSLDNSEAHTSFPICLSIQANYENTTFTDGQCNELASEFVNDSIVWIMLDTLKIGPNTIYMHNIAGQSHDWPIEYQGVWHLDSYDDSGQASFDLSVTGTPAPTVGKIGDAVKFNANSYLHTLMSNTASNGITVTFWLKFDNAADFVGPSNYINGFVSKDWVFGIESTSQYSKLGYSMYSEVYPYGTNVALCTPPITSGSCSQYLAGDSTWHQIALSKSYTDTVAMQGNGTYTGSQDFKMYFDGVDVSVHDFWGTDTLKNIASNFFIGSSPYYSISGGTASILNRRGTRASIDEVMYIDVKKNEDWVYAQYLNQLDISNYSIADSDISCFTSTDFATATEFNYQAAKIVKVFDIVGREICTTIPSNQPVVIVYELNGELKRRIEIRQ